MILRNIGVRHGWKAVASPITRSYLRALSTESSTTATTTENAAAVPPTTPASTPAHAFYNPAIPRRPGAAAATPDTVPQDYVTFTRLQQKTSKLGSVMEKRYSPGDVFKNPPGPKDVTLELLMASQAHMGHHTALWNPQNQRYIYGVRQGIHIISLEATAAHLRRAARVVEEVAFRGGLILFVGTRKGQMEIVTRAAQLAGACHLFTKWTPGTVTNRDQILASAEVRIVDEMDRNLDGFTSHLQERRPLLPDLVVCLNPLENFVMLHECALASIPTIGVIDTDADPTKVTYTIPANDDSLRAMAVVASVLGRAGEMGQRRRLQSAKEGAVTWENPTDIKKFMRLEQLKAEAEAEKAMKEAKEALGME